MYVLIIIISSSFNQIRDYTFTTIELCQTAGVILVTEIANVISVDRVSFACLGIS
jgi:hypothetical protein